MDLPTYTNIWRIEKRLYKLYDLRLPMPLPIVWIGVFVGVLAPWSLLLWLIGIKFQAPWHVLYLVPPGIVTWLSTRPVIENKRLTELLQSQVRYMGEPRSWCRMAPTAEPETLAFAGRVWRVSPETVRVKAPRKARHGMRGKAPVRATSATAREVRPAVAAAAAAATHAPVAETPQPRTGWGRVVTPRRGTAPALGSAAAPKTPDPVRHDDLSPRTTAQPATAQAEPAPAPRAEAPRTPQRAGAPRTPRWGDKGPRPAHEESAPPAQDEASPAAWGEGAQAEVKPIGTEALRRLRRLAATADSAPAAPRPELDSPHLHPTHTDAPASGDTEVSPAAQRSGDAERPDTAHASEGVDPSTSAHVSGDAPSAAVRASGDVTSPVARASADDTAAAERDPGDDASAVARDSGVPEDLREQHRKGQPPRAGAAASAPETQQVWPLSPKSKPKPGLLPPSLRNAVSSVHTGPQIDDPSTPPTGHPIPSKPGASRPAASEPSLPARGTLAPGTPTPEASAPGAPVSGTPGQEAPEQGSPASAPSKAVPGKAGPVKPPVSIRAVPTVGRAAEAAPGAAVPVPRPGEGETRIRRVESVVGRDGSGGGWRRLAQVVVGGSGGRTDGSEVDEARARGVFVGSRRVVVLGCTGGAGQSTTALMLGHTFARFRDDRVLAVDANTGGSTLTSKIKAESPETLTSLLSGLDQVSGYLSMRAYTTRTASGLEVVAADTDLGAEQRLADRTLFSDHRLGQAMRLLDRHYKLAVIDPAAALAARVLPYADQLVLVVPASDDAADAVAMTFEWLDGHGCADLRRRAVMVVNGVSRRSMSDVEQAEAVARGRCRAIVRVPWEDDLAPGANDDLVEPGQLRPAGRRAYLALAGVVVAGFAAGASGQTARPSEEELAQ